MESRDFALLAYRGASLKPCLCHPTLQILEYQKPTFPLRIRSPYRPMPPSYPPLPPLPQPTREVFDPFNSTSTGHQHADNSVSSSTSWRASRTHKLSHQLRDITGRGGAQHISHLV